jgi:hypothetical protein
MVFAFGLTATVSLTFTFGCFLQLDFFIRYWVASLFFTFLFVLQVIIVDSLTSRFIFILIERSARELEKILANS